MYSDDGPEGLDRLRRVAPTLSFAPPADEPALAQDADLVGADASLAETAARRLGGRAIALAGLVVVLGVVLSRVLGFVRTGVLNAQFGGDSPQLAAFNAAFRIPDTLFQLVAAGAIGSALVPVASELLARGEEERARRVIGTLANLMVAALVPLAAVVFLLAPFLVSTLLAPGFAPDQQQLTADLSRWLLLSPILLAVGAVATAGLQSVGIFGAPAMAPNVYNIAIILAALLLTPFFGVHALVVGVVLGAAGHLATQLPAVVRHGLYRPVFDVRDPAVVETLRLMAPRALGMGATQIVFFLYISLISLLPAPHNTTETNVWTTAFVTLQIPVGLIGVPLGIVLLPPLSQAVAQGAQERYRALIERSLRLLLYVTLPLMGLMAALAAPGLTLLWRHGGYTGENVSETTAVFLIFLVGLVAHVLIALLAPIFYAGKDTKTPVMAALLAVAVDLVAALVLFPFFGVGGLALAIGIGAWAEVAMLLYLIERRIGFDLDPVGHAVVRFAPGALAASAAAFVVDRGFEAVFGAAPGFLLLIVDLGIAGLAAAAIYAGWSWLIRLEELDASLTLVRQVLHR